MILSTEQIAFIDESIAQNVNREGSIIRSEDPNLISFILFNPMQAQNLTLKCPTHNIEQLKFTNRWTHNFNQKGVTPRLLYGLEENTILISAIYSCSKCDIPYRAHHPLVMKQEDMTVKFHLYSRSGLTEEAYNFIINLVSSGMTFEGISTCLQTAKGQRLGCQGIGQAPSTQTEKFKVPGHNLIQSIFVQDFYKKLPLYEAELKKIRPTQVSFDHTFKVAALIKMNDGESFNKSKRFQQPFSTLFLLLDEGGRVASFTLTKTKSLSEIHGNLKELASRMGTIKLAHSDNCCSDESEVKLIFGSEVPIKLDLFHALARVTGEVKKRKISIRHRRLFNYQLRMAVRRDGDHEKKRTQDTASARQISGHLESLRDNWKGIIPKKAVKAIDNLLIHARKGCMSNIPCGQGSMRNENFHRHIRLFMKGRPLLGTETLLALLHTFIYSWNARQSGETHLNIAAKSASYKAINSEPYTWSFGFPFQGKENVEDPISKLEYDSLDISDIIEATEGLTSMSTYLSHPSLPLTAEDIILRSNFECLPCSHLTSSDQEQYNMVDMILEGICLRRKEAEETELGMFEASAQTLSVLQLNAEYASFLDQIGLSVEGSPSELAKTLKEFSVTELLCNYQEYKKRLKGIDMKKYIHMVSKLREPGEYSMDMANILFRALSNVLRTNIVLLATSPTSPVTFLRPTKSAINNNLITLVYSSGARHFVGVTSCEPKDKEMVMSKKHKKCACGRKDTTGCISSSCSCYAKGLSCDIEPCCWCRNCANKFGKRGASIGQNAECSCGKNLKTQPSGALPCSSTRCKCFLANKPCSFCKCKYCNNKHGARSPSSASNCRTPTKRGSESKHSGNIPRTPTRQFLQEHSKNKVPSRWTLSESILLNEIMYHKMRKKDVTMNKALKMFNHIMHMKPDLGNVKTITQITQKWKHIRRKNLNESETNM